MCSWKNSFVMITAHGLFTHEAGEYTHQERFCYAYLVFNAKATRHCGVSRMCVAELAGTACDRRHTCQDTYPHLRKQSIHFKFTQTHTPIAKGILVLRGVTDSFLSVHITWYHMVSTVSSHCRLHSSLLWGRAHQIFLISLLPVSSPWCCYNHCAVCLSHTFPHYSLKPIFRLRVK